MILTAAVGGLGRAVTDPVPAGRDTAWTAHVWPAVLTATASGEANGDLPQIGADLRQPADRGRSHRVVVAVHADVVIARQAQPARSADRGRHRRQREHRRPVHLDPVDRPPTPRPVLPAVLSQQPCSSWPLNSAGDANA